MTSSLNIKEINDFRCVSVIMYTFEDRCHRATHIVALVGDKLRKKLVTNSESA